MSKLDELIAELCPDGVEFFTVKELTKKKTIKTKTPSIKIKRNDYQENGITPIISQELEYISGYCDFIDNSIPKNNYVCFGDHSEHIKFVDFAFVQGADGLKIMSLDEEKLMAKFFYYAISSFYVRHNNYERHFKYLNDTEIPVPPLEVQREIVRILDSFTLLTAELTAELTARKKQYEYYRDTLLTFNDNNPLHSLISSYCPNGVEYKKIGDIAFISTGSKLRDIQESHSLYEYINAGTTNSGYSLDWNCDGDVVTTPSRGQGGIGYVGYQKNKFWLGPLCYKIVGNADFVLNKYLYYYLSNNSYEILSLKKDGGVPAINKSDLEELILPVPPLEVQRQIVQILDRFDTICSDLNIGLPAEIEARQKQYEFYRDKLLSFKQL